MKLYYFDVYAKGEAIRILLNHAKVPFEDIRMDGKDFKLFKEKGYFEFGQVPVLEMPNGHRFSQSYSILRMLGKTYGYYPVDELRAWSVDSAL